MEDRILGRTGKAVSVIGLGTWQLGADWGEVAEKDATVRVSLLAVQPAGTPPAPTQGPASPSEAHVCSFTPSLNP